MQLIIAIILSYKKDDEMKVDHLLKENEIKEREKISYLFVTQTLTMLCMCVCVVRNSEKVTDRHKHTKQTFTWCYVCVSGGICPSLCEYVLVCGMWMRVCVRQCV